MSDEARPSAIFLIGFPGSGKSSWREHRLKALTRPATVVSTDDLLHAFARAEGLSYREAWKRAPSAKLDSRARALLREAVEAGRDLIVDRTNLRAATRARYLRLIPPAYARTAVVFVTAPEQLRERLRARAEAGGHEVPWGFVVGMMARYEAPQPGEFDRVDYVRAAPPGATKP
jgi:predicted kinase